MFSSLYFVRNREGDITVGDFWGIDKVNSDFSDDKGVSLVIINTPKGAGIFEAVKEHLEVSCQTMEEAEKKQLRLIKPAEVGYKRDEFWKDYKKKGIKYALKKYTTVGFFVRTKRQAKKLLVKLKLYR